MKIKALFILLSVCILFAGCVADTAHTDTNESLPHSPENQAEIQSEESAAASGLPSESVSTENDDIKRLIGEYQKELWGVSELPGLKVHQSVPYDKGTLVMAEFQFDGEISPELYYIEDNAILYSTVYSYTWWINYTLFNGDTILFGADAGLYCCGAQIDEKYLTDVYTVSAGFADETVSAQCDESGFILIKEGYARPLTYEVENREGKSLGIINIPKEAQVTLSGDDIVLNYCPMTTLKAYNTQCSIVIAGEKTGMSFGQLQVKPEIPVSFIWMDQWRYADEPTAASVPFEIISDNQIYEYFWLDIGNATTDSTMEDLLMTTGKEIPDEAGTYMLVFNTAEGYYTCVINVALN